MLINATDAEEARIAVVEDGVLQELHVEIASRTAYLGNIYKGRVVNIEPSIGAAFVAFGGRTNGFLHASDVLPAYSRDDFRLEDVVEGRARVGSGEGPDSLRAALDDDEDHEDAKSGDAKKGAATASKGGRKPARTEEDDDASDAGDAEPGSGAAAESDDAGDGSEGGPDGGGPDGGGADGGGAEEDGEPAEAGTAGEAEATPAPRARRRRRRRRASTAEADAEGGGTAVEAGLGDGDGFEERDEDRDADEFGGGVDVETDDHEDAAAADGDSGNGVERPRGPKRQDQKSGSPRRRRARENGRPRVPIDQLLKRGQEVIVQVTKEGIGAKGPTLTTFVSLPGRSLVLMPSLPKCGVSRKIDDPKERRRLKRIVKDLDETGNGGVGFIVRTNGVGKTKVDLQRDRDYLKKIFELIAQRVQVTRAPALLYQESDLVLKAMRDLFSPEIEEVVVDSRDVYLRIRDFAEKLMPHMADRIKLHELVTPLFHSFGIEQEVEKLYQPRVELPNGGSIVIDQAEALVAIDVNSGRFKPGADLEETALRTNLEAIPDIVRHLRLRDLGGLIMIDFIDMNHDKHRRQVERRIVDELKGDRARIKVGRISPFGMLELTRQRVGPGLKHTVFTMCRHCNGSGLVRTVPSKSLSVLREVRAVLNLKGFSILQVFVSPLVNDYLVNHKRRQIIDLEESVGKSILFKAEPSYPIEMVHYRFMTADGQEAKVAIPAGLGVKA